MSLDPTTFDYLKPTPGQIEQMQALRANAKLYAQAIQDYVPEGPDKTYILRQLRTVAMWVNVALTRWHDGAPRSDGQGVNEVELYDRERSGPAADMTSNL